jgi:hypothetical protein
VVEAVEDAKGKVLTITETLLAVRALKALYLAQEAIAELFIPQADTLTTFFFLQEEGGLVVQGQVRQVESGSHAKMQQE